MPTTDKRIDAYIARSADFARPILEHLRRLVHRACPDVKETVKWGFPHFEHKGILCSMAAFKQHCTFGFWKATLMSDPHRLFSKVGKTAMGHLGRIEKLADLPPDRVLVEYIKDAVRLNADGVALPQKKRREPRKPLRVPPYMKQALTANKRAKRTFEAFSPSHQREYIEWITEARTEATRTKRLAQAIQWMTEGKERNWKYAQK